MTIIIQLILYTVSYQIKLVLNFGLRNKRVYVRICFVLHREKIDRGPVTSHLDSSVAINTIGQK